MPRAKIVILEGHHWNKNGIRNWHQKNWPRGMPRGGVVLWRWGYIRRLCWQKRRGRGNASANANAVPVAGAVSSDWIILVANAAPKNGYESMGGVTNINGGLMIMNMYMIKCMLCQRLFPGRHSADSWPGPYPTSWWYQHGYRSRQCRQYTSRSISTTYGWAWESGSGTRNTTGLVGNCMFDMASKCIKYWLGSVVKLFCF